MEKDGFLWLEHQNSLIHISKVHKEPILAFGCVKKPKTLLFPHHFLTSNIRSKISPKEMKKENQKCNNLRQAIQ